MSLNPSFSLTNQSISISPPIIHPISISPKLASDNASSEALSHASLPNSSLSAMIGPYMLGSTLGEGSTAKVKLGTHATTGQKVAVKIVSLKNMDVTMIAKMKREVTLMKLTAYHPNIVQLLDIYETDNTLFLIMEYMAGGELLDLMSTKKCLKEKDVMRYFLQMISAIEHCHSHLIIHRDIKPENLLLDKSGTIVKLTDFGMSTIQIKNGLLKTSCGSPHYASPEICGGHSYAGPPTDIWSLGVVLYAMLSGRLPFNDTGQNNIKLVIAKVKSGIYTIPENVPPLAADLIRKMIVTEPLERISIHEIYQHPWIASHPNVISKAMISRSSGSGTWRKNGDLRLHHHPINAILNEQALNDMSRIGYEDMIELNRKLQESGSNMEKCLYQLLLETNWNIEANREAALKAWKKGGKTVDTSTVSACRHNQTLLNVELVGSDSSTKEISDLFGSLVLEMEKKSWLSRLRSNPKNKE